MFLNLETFLSLQGAFYLHHKCILWQGLLCGRVKGFSRYSVMLTPFRIQLNNVFCPSWGVTCNKWISSIFNNFRLIGWPVNVFWEFSLRQVWLYNRKKFRTFTCGHLQKLVIQGGFLMCRQRNKTHMHSQWRPSCTSLYDFSWHQ